MYKKLNNRGFAISTVLFGTLILFMLLFLSIMGILLNYRNNLKLLTGNENTPHSARGIATIKANKTYSTGTIDNLKAETNVNKKISGLYCFKDGCRYVSTSDLK